ncbi:MAG TPA: ATP-binding protein [Catenuloplanes sp.]
MPERPDYAALIVGHTAIIDRINSGESGLSVLGDLLQLAQETLGALGMTFAESGPAGTRVIAATGACAWAIGRPVDPGNARLTASGRSVELTVDALTAELAGQLAGRGLRRVLAARVELGGLTVGSLQAYFPAAQPPRDPATGSFGPELHQLITYLAACAARMYSDQAGLPVHGDGPVVAALADGLAVIDREGFVQLWNPAAEQVTGRAAVDMLNQPLPFPLPPPGQVIDQRMPDGHWLKITSGDLPGSLGSRVVTFRDVTDQHRRELDRDLFVAVTSHELRTPVTVIKGYADTLTTHWNSLGDSGRQEAVRVIGQRSGELARLVDRLLASASEAGPAGGAATPFDLVEALRTAVAGLPADLRRRLRVDLPRDLPKALGDRASVPTLLTELATNADKYSPADTPVELTAQADARTVAFRVSDRGVGIRPEHVERAFDRFWQGESGDRRRYRGAGLGLYLVRRVVERQDGWVSMRPRDGGGTVVEVRLPRG